MSCARRRLFLLRRREPLDTNDRLRRHAASPRRGKSAIDAGDDRILTALGIPEGDADKARSSIRDGLCGDDSSRTVQLFIPGNRK